MLIGGFPDTIDGFRDWNIVWLEGFVDVANLLIIVVNRAAHGCFAHHGAFIDSFVVWWHVDVDANAIAQMLPRCCNERFGFNFGIIVSVG